MFAQVGALVAVSLEERMCYCYILARCATSCQQLRSHV